ncbi:hypothetical protein HYO65_gp107 [Tenacibaculum phage PTm1]|uniref:Uncharacterized protein n=2 Tax=Shirahamavirus PTm1 TaxID=2846435 RepID=A0A5S9BZ17_9CAUD|nr:hypothetical protein HYO65_gp107 [Tenacibaculum phage PTm1]BBI90499.1 hypothetical protein [Tenacibaculum phage PTm1]BBI90807.1 hypothetical protein [Tenacibaculum phage PTm5]
MNRWFKDFQTNNTFDKIFTWVVVLIIMVVGLVVITFFKKDDLYYENTFIFEIQYTDGMVGTDTIKTVTVYRNGMHHFYNGCLYVEESYAGGQGNKPTSKICGVRRYKLVRRNSKIIQNVTKD